MKLIVIIILTTACQAIAFNGASQKRIDLDLKNKTITSVLKSIESNFGYRFFYSDSVALSQQRVDILAEQATIDYVMQKLLQATTFSYKKMNKGLVVIIGADHGIAVFPVKGKITNEAGDPLGSVNIIEKGTNNGTTTAIDGSFSLNVQDENAVLVVSSVGYIATEQGVKEGGFLNIVLKATENKLDEIVVQAYGTTTKRKTTSAISTMDMETVAGIPVQSIRDAFAGRLAGVIVESTSGAPGAKARISIRGGGDPLFVIDNIIRSSNDFANLNPNDIEDLSVLQDAAATALYGVSGANGVVVVTTKKGRAGRVSVNYSFNKIFSQPTIFPKPRSSYEQLSSINKIYRQEGKSQPFSDADLQKYRDGSEPLLFPNTDWQELTMKDFAPESRHDLSVTSGNKMLTYYAALSHYDQGTILRTEKNYNKRTTYRLNTVSDFEKINLKITTGVDGFIESGSQPSAGYGGIYSHIQNRSPREVAKNEFGLPTAIPDNPVRELDPLSGYNKSTSRVFNGNLQLEYSAHFLKGLRLRFNGVYNMYNSDGKIWNYLAPGYAIGSTTPINANPPSLSRSFSEGNTTTLQGYLIYSKKMGDHNLDFTGVYEQQTSRSSDLGGARVGYQIIFDQFVAGPATDQTVGGNEYESWRASYLGRLTYSYKAKYSVELSGRRDGDYLFPPGNQWGNFYAVSAGYTLSEEPFMRELKNKGIFDFLKLRGSYGLLGDNAGVAAWQYLSAYNVSSTSWVIDGKHVQGTSEQAALPNINFSWQEIESSDLGLDFATLKNRLAGKIDYFYTRRTGFVTSDPRYAQTLGINLPPINFVDGAVRKEGFDFSINWADNLRNDFSYKVGVNFTRFNTINEKTTESEAAMKNPYTRSSNIASDVLTTGYLTDGFYQDNLDLLTGARKRISKVAAGDVKYFDANGDGQINGDDTRRIGANAFPRVNYGVTLDLGYKGVYFSTVIQGSGNRDRLLGEVLRSQPQTFQTYEFQTDYWRPDNTGALLPRAVSSPTENGGNNFDNSETWIIQSKYIRLKYLQLGYDFKYKVLKNSAVRQMRLFVSGTNLLTSANSMKFFIDPESDTSNYGYPIQRTFAIGINAGF